MILEKEKTMSDNFIPLNQSTPVRNRRQPNRNQQNNQNNVNNQNNQNGHQQRNRNQQPNGHQQQNGPRHGGHVNNSRSSYGSNSSNNSIELDRNNIELYLDPEMLQDPWANFTHRN